MSGVHIRDIPIPLVNYIHLIKYHKTSFMTLFNTSWKTWKYIMKEPDAVLRLSIQLIPEFCKTK